MTSCLAPSVTAHWRRCCRNACPAFARSQEYPAIETTTEARSVPVNNSRKRWRLAKRLQPTPLQALRAFFEARGGPTEPLYFYDPSETNPKFSWDPTGVTTTRRYTVRFDGQTNRTSDERV